MGPAANLIWLSRLKPVRLAPSGLWSSPITLPPAEDSLSNSGVKTMLNRLLKPLASRLGWLVLGIVIPGGVSWAWPSQTAVAFSSDRNDKFAVPTAMTGPTLSLIHI